MKVKGLTREELKEELDVIFTNHKLWLLNSEDGERADLSGLDLRDAYLEGANLRGVNLRGADLRRANLCEADLSEVDFSGANLDIANLYGANLTGADLSGAYFFEADLRGANLRGVNLRGADLRRANLCEADLRGADLSEANLYGADLSGAKLDWSMVCPEKGSFIGYKRCSDGRIVELEIPEDALRSSATTNKCRCSKAKVVSITTWHGEPSDCTSAVSMHDSNFIYKVGEVVSVDNFDTDRWNECSTGIHFFMTREEAEKY